MATNRVRQTRLDKASRVSTAAFAVRSALIAVVMATLAFASVCTPVGADEGVDTALLVSVDVSQSVDEERYHLQMEGIAKALEDPGVVSSITSGPKGGILFAMITWSDQIHLDVNWRRIGPFGVARNSAGGSISSHFARMVAVNNASLSP